MEEEKRKKLAAVFFDKLDSLDTGCRVALKRCCGKRLTEADGRAFGTFYRILPREVPAWEEDIWFYAGCVRALWRPDEKPNKKLEDAMATKNKKEEEGFKNRFLALLDTPWGEDGYFQVKLTRIIKLFKQQVGYVIDAQALLDDLLYWNHPDRYIQKKWARAFNRTENNKN